MNRRTPHSAFTLIELLVVMAIFALLLAITIPALRGAREQSRRTTCLMNLSSIGVAATAYSTEDARELVIPVHPMMVTYMPPEDYWLRRTAIWFATGGRTPTMPFLTNQGPRLLNDSTPWGGSGRPLTRYVYRRAVQSESQSDPMRLFQCPSDRGYPADPHVDDSPHENAERGCYETLGNSYRANLYALFPRASEPYAGAFSLGPWGHRLGSIPSPGTLPIFGEPLFFNMIGLDNGVVNPDLVRTAGWHQRELTDNLLFADGSARATRATAIETVDDETSRARMAVGTNWDLIVRGDGWRLDVWPMPGVRIWAHDRGNKLWNHPYTDHPADRHRFWPFTMARDLSP